MSRYMLLLIAVILCVNSLESQIRCATTAQQIEIKKNQDPDYKRFHNQWREMIDQGTTPNNRVGDCPDGTIKVPVAFHFEAGLVPVAQEACIVSAALEYVEELNREAGGLDRDAGLFANFTSCYGEVLGNSCIDFVLANQNHPAGYALSEGNPAVTFGALSFTVGPGDNTPRDPQWAGYLNVFVHNIPFLGVSNGIPGNFSGDGVSILPCTFSTGNVSCPGVSMSMAPGCTTLYDEGETLIHELGHYLGLFHIWGDDGSSCAGSDQIGDTPNMGPSYSGYNSCATHTSCADLPSTCGSEDMYMNFMSYSSDHCYYMLSAGQAGVMNATAQAAGFTTDYPNVFGGNNPPCTDDGNVAIGAAPTTANTSIISGGMIQSAATITNSSTVSYRASTNVDLFLPFTVDSDGSIFTAQIGDCETSNQ